MSERSLSERTYYGQVSPFHAFLDGAAKHLEENVAVYVTFLVLLMLVLVLLVNQKKMDKKIALHILRGDRCSTKQENSASQASKTNINI